MNSVIFLFKNGISNVYPDIKPFENNIGQLLNEKKNEVSHLIIHTSHITEMYYMEDLLDFSKIQSVYNNINIHIEDDHEIAEHKLLHLDIIREFYNLNF